MSRRPYLVAFSVILLITLAVLNLPERQSLQLKLAWGSVFTPLFGLARSVEDLAGRARDSVLPRGELLRELEILRRQNATLRFQLLQTEAMRQENLRLREAVTWRRQVPWRLRLGRVAGHDPANWWRSILVDLGSREDIRVDAPVLSPDGLVGRVAEVGYTRSRVVLVGDPNCRFAAQVKDSRAKGIIAPDESSFDRQVVQLLYVPTTANLTPGAEIVTSGDGGVFPKGLPVGRIVDVVTNEFGLYLEARVRLAANLNRLEEVWMMLP